MNLNLGHPTDDNIRGYITKYKDNTINEGGSAFKSEPEEGIKFCDSGFITSDKIGNLLWI